MIYFIGSLQSDLIRIGYSGLPIAVAFNNLQRKSADELAVQASLAELREPARDELWRLFEFDLVRSHWYRPSERLGGLIDWAVEHEHASAVEMWRFLGVPGVVDSRPPKIPFREKIEPAGWEEHWLKHEQKRERTPGQIARAQRRARKRERRRRHAS